MALVKSTYGKARVRVMRIHRDGERHEVRELSLQVMLTGDFARVYTHADNTLAVATDTIKNIVNVVARENLALDTEPFCVANAQPFLTACRTPIASCSTTTARTRRRCMPRGRTSRWHRGCPASRS
jgi:urate oxidase